MGNGKLTDAIALNRMRRLRAAVVSGGPGVLATHMGRGVTLQLAASQRHKGAGIWHAYGSKGGSYTNTRRLSSHITSLMRRINALQDFLGCYNFTSGNVTSGSGDDEFDVATGVVELDGELYVADSDNDRIKVVDAWTGEYIRKWGSNGTGDGQFDSPAGIATDGTQIYVVDTNNDRVQVFDTDGTFDSKWGTSGSGNGQLDSPFGILIYNNEIYITEITNDRVQVFNMSGAYQRKWGSAGTSDGQFDQYPTGICEMGGEIYVSDGGAFGSDRVQVFNTSGTFQRKWTGVDAPIAIGADGTLIYHVSNSSNGGTEKIRSTNSTGTLQEEIAGGSPGSFDVPPYTAIGLRGIYVMSPNTFWIGGGSRVFYYGQREWRTYPTEDIDDAVSMGTPDGGSSVPADDDIVGTIAATNYITDMREVIQPLATYYINSVTSNRFNWTDLDADNLYNVALGSGYDWERTAATMEDDEMYDVDINEIDACVTKLEASTLDVPT